jgi:hypothetical protein
MSWPRSSLQEPERTKKQTEKRNEKRIRRLELFVVVRKANIRLEMEGYDTLTGLRKGVTQGEFDKANEDYRKKKSKTACSEVECQPVNPQRGDT